jgi:hypothetical protein
MRMTWSEDAEKAIGKVPFFVRKRVIGHVEDEASRMGDGAVRLDHVHACRKKFIEGNAMNMKQTLGLSDCGTIHPPARETAHVKNMGSSKIDRGA